MRVDVFPGHCLPSLKTSHESVDEISVIGIQPFRGRFLLALAATLLASAAAKAQFIVGGRQVQAHGFFSQGFLKSDTNNYLTLPSRNGSFQLVDGGLNLSSQLTNRLRVGAQAYVRDVGNLGKGHVTLDWAFGDFRVNDWFGVRVGQVKTVLGLYNDTQDVEFLHTWALLPQSIYPMDLRGYNLSHLGADLYGHVPLRHAGTLSYTVYGGKAPPDRDGGLQYGLASFGHRVGARRGTMYGADAKWMPTAGLTIGASALRSKTLNQGENQQLGGPFRSDANMAIFAYAAQYSRDSWRVEWEYNRTSTHSLVHTALSPYGPYMVEIPYDLRGSYVAVAYRASRWLELGTYHSRFYPNADQQVPVYRRYLPSEERHIYDQTVAARFDFRSHWDLKVEGHFMDGYGDPGTARGFYPQDNPQGLARRTNLLVIRLGFNR
jgi:hypothetical protein